MYEDMEKLNIPYKIINLVKMMLNKTSNKVIVERGALRSFGVTRGLRETHYAIQSGSEESSDWDTTLSIKL